MTEDSSLGDMLKHVLTRKEDLAQKTKEETYKLIESSIRLAISRAKQAGKCEIYLKDQNVSEDLKDRLTKAKEDADVGSDSLVLGVMNVIRNL